MPVRGRTGRVAGRAHWRAGNYQGVPSLAREVRGRTGQAALSPSARAGGCTPGMPASCVPQGRKGLSKSNGADVRHRLAQARRSAAAPRRELPGVQPPRRDSGGTPRLEMGKCTTTAQTRINTGVFIVVQVYKNRRKRTRMGYTCTPRQQWKAA